MSCNLMSKNLTVFVLLAAAIGLGTVCWPLLADDQKNQPTPVTVELQGTLHILKPHAIGYEDGVAKMAKVGDRILLQYYFDPKVHQVKKVKFEVLDAGPAAVEVEDIFRIEGVGSLGVNGEPRTGMQYFGVLVKAVRKGNPSAGIVLEGSNKSVPRIFEIEE